MRSDQNSQTEHFTNVGVPTGLLSACFWHIRHSYLSIFSSLVRQSQSQLARCFAIEKLRATFSILEPSPSSQNKHRA